MSQGKPEEKTEGQEKPTQTLAWKCLCDECPNRVKCFELLKKTGALKKLGIKSPDEMGEKLLIAFVSFLAGAAADEIIRAIFSTHRRKRIF